MPYLTPEVTAFVRVLPKLRGHRSLTACLFSSSGSANVSFLVPDTITQWEASAFCVNGEAGFGISPKAYLQISQPFFVEIASPFSIVRNEQSDVVVSVFSYLSTCVEVSHPLDLETKIQPAKLFTSLFIKYHHSLFTNKKMCYKSFLSIIFRNNYLQF